MTGVIQISHLALVDTLIKALQGVGQAPTPTISLTRFFGRPGSPCDPTIDEWLADFDVFVRQCGVLERERAVVLVDYLGGCAKDEVLCHPDEVRRDFGALVSLLRRMFGPLETVTSLYAEFYSRMQSERETLAEYSRALIRLHQRIEGAAPTMAERQALTVLADGALKHQFVVGLRDEWVRHELRRLVLRLADKPLIVVREVALCLMCEEEARAVQMRPMVEKAAPALSAAVGGSVSCSLSLDAVVLGDGGVSSGAVRKHVLVGDVSDAVSGGLCDLDSVSGGDDPLLPDAVRVGGRLSVVGDTLVCDSGEARSRGGDTAVMVVPGVDQRVWVDELICADGSLRPEPPPLNALWLRHGPPVILTAAC